MFFVILLILFVLFLLTDLILKRLRSKKKKVNISNLNSPKYINFEDINEFHPGTGNYGWEELFYKETNNGTWFKGYLSDDEMEANAHHFDFNDFDCEIKEFHKIDVSTDQNQIVFFVPNGESKFTLYEMEGILM